MIKDSSFLQTALEDQAYDHMSDDYMLTSLKNTLLSAQQSESKGTDEGNSAAVAKTAAIKNI